MSYGAAALKNFAGIISLTIAGGVLAGAFKVAGILDEPKEDPKPKCELQKDPKSGLNIYNPDCKPDVK